MFIADAYVFKTLSSDQPCVLEYRNQTNYVTQESILDRSPWVPSVQSTHSIRFSGPKIYNAIPLSIKKNKK